MMVSRYRIVGAAAASLMSLLALAEVSGDVFESTCLFSPTRPLFDGQVAAQALRAATLTVGGGRVPHSLHAYFLRCGETSAPVTYRVSRDRDGGSFTVRRVVAEQSGRSILTMSASFRVPEPWPQAQVSLISAAARPDACPAHALPHLVSFEARLPDQRFPHRERPARLWFRCTEDLGEDEPLHACALAYLSDAYAGVAPFDSATHGGGPSRDHSLWFHRAVRASEWMLLDQVPHTVGPGRGWYTGSVYRGDGTLVASFAQEALFENERSPRDIRHEPPDPLLHGEKGSRHDTAT
jgi:acyl-CoA thioesterase II